MQSWSSILYGNDVLVISPTGTGKTLAYCLPMVIHILSRLNHCYDHDHHHDKIQNSSSDSSNTDNNSSWNGIDDNKKKKRKYPSSSSVPPSHNFLSPMALILLPTRELAIQVYSIIKSFKYHFKITSGIVYGGHDKIQQIEKLRSACCIHNYRNSSNGSRSSSSNSSSNSSRSSSSSNSSSNMGLHILVATPGRLIDFIQSNNNSTNDNDDELSTMMINISNISYLVIDEADRMLNLGFIEQLEKIFFHLSYDKRQSLLFSATFLGKLNHIIEKYLKDPVIIRCNAMEFHDHSRVKNNNDNDDNNNNSDGTENDNSNYNYNNNNIIHDINDNTSISNKNHGYNIDDDKSSNSNYILDNSNYNANADDDKNDQNNNDDESRSSNKIVHFDENNNNSNNNDNKTSSLTISPSIQQKIHVCASHKKPRLLIKYILQCRNHEKINKVRQVGSMLIFTNKIKTLKFLSEFLGNGIINV